MDEPKYNAWKLYKTFYPQCMAALVVSIGLVSDGMQYGWPSPIIPVLESKDTPVVIQKSDIAWIENISCVGNLLGIPFTVITLNRQGRKVSLIIAAFLKLIGWLLIGYASSVLVLLLGRFVSGFAANAAFISSPMYIAEIANKKIRGSLLSLVYMMMLLGVLLMYSIGPYVSVFVSSLVGILFVSLQIILLLFIPKSPYFLLLIDKKMKAKNSIKWFITNDLENDFIELTEVVERQQSEKGRFIDLFKINSNRKAVIILTFLNSLQHLSGISIMVMNLETILSKSSSIIDPNKGTILFAVLMIVGAFGASSLVDKAGRKFLLVTSSIFTSLSLLTLAVYLTLINNGVAMKPYNWIPVVSVMAYAVAFKCGLGMIPIISTGELFPTSIKAMGMTIADTVYVVFAFISIYLYQFLVQNYNMQTAFYVFSICTFCSIFFTIFYIPETKGKSLEEIQLILKRQSSKTSKHDDARTSML